MDGGEQTVVELLARRLREGRFTLVERVDQTWRQRDDWGELTLRTAAALSQAGVSRGDHLVLIAENSVEWILLDLAAQVLGVVLTPLHTTLSPQQWLAQITHSQARGVVLGNEAIAARLAQVQHEIPAELAFFSLTPAADPRSGAALPVLSDLRALAPVAEGETLLRQTLANCRPDAPATLLYTSGTTGEPLGVLLTQGNLASNAQGILAAFGLRPEECRLNVLPLSHIFARTCDLYVSLAGGTRLALSAARDDLFRLGQWPELGVTMVNAVPLLLERCLSVAVEAGTSVQAVFGTTLRRINSGGAPLSPAAFRAFAEAGLPILEGYGLTEAGPVVSLTPPGEHRLGSVGKVLANLEVRIAADGEIVVRGPSVSPGYWRNPAASAVAVRDGWLFTGDLGRQDADGFLYITGRKKELIVTASGKKIAPVLIEALLAEDPLIAQVCVVGEGRSSLAALVVPHWAVLAREVSAAGLPPLEVSQTSALSACLEQRTDLHIWLVKRIASRLQHLSLAEQVRHCRLLATPFSTEAGELTAKFSLRRHKIASTRAAEIAAAYLT